MAELDLDEIERKTKNQIFLEFVDVVAMVTELRAHRAAREATERDLSDEDLSDLEVEIAHNLDDEDERLWARFKRELLAHRAALGDFEALVYEAEMILQIPLSQALELHGSMTRLWLYRACKVARARLEELKR